MSEAKLPSDDDSNYEDENEEEEKEDEQEETDKTNNRKREYKKERKVNQHEGETDADFEVRRQKFYRQTHSAKKKREYEEAFTRMMSSAKTAAVTDDEDFFIKNIVGVRNFELVDSKKKRQSCSNAVTKRLCVNRLLREYHYESKEGRGRGKRQESMNEFEVQFHVDLEQEDVKKTSAKKSGKGRAKTVEEVCKEPLIPWLRVKKSSIEGAGLGLFADKDFKEKSMIGMYMGGNTGHPDYRMKAHGVKEMVNCFSFDSSLSMEEHSAKTMGMQMMNDPNIGLKKGEKPPFIVNAEVKSDMFVQALTDIHEGEEIFIDYQWTDNSDFSNDEDEEGKEKDGKDDEDDGGGKPKAKPSSKKNKPSSKKNKPSSKNDTVGV